MNNSISHQGVKNLIVRETVIEQRARCQTDSVKIGKFVDEAAALESTKKRVSRMRPTCGKESISHKSFHSIILTVISSNTISSQRHQMRARECVYGVCEGHDRRDVSRRGMEHRKATHSSYSA